MYGLSNEQLAFTYLSLTAVRSKYEEVLSKGNITQLIIGVSGIKHASYEYDEILKDISTSEHYRLLKEVISTLDPIFELIQDVEPEMVARVKEAFLI